MIKKFTVRINKKSHTVTVDENMPLLWVLRDILDMKGTKYGCGVYDSWGKRLGVTICDHVGCQPHRVESA